MMEASICDGNGGRHCLSGGGSVFGDGVLN